MKPVPPGVKHAVKEVCRFAEKVLPPGVAFLFMIGSIQDPEETTEGWQYFAGNVNHPRAIAGALREAAADVEKEIRRLGL